MRADFPFCQIYFFSVQGSRAGREQVVNGELLKISPRIPCILLERFSYEEDCLVEYTSSVVRGDKYVFKIELNNEK